MTVKFDDGQIGYVDDAHSAGIEVGDKIEADVLDYDGPYTGVVAEIISQSD